MCEGDGGGEVLVSLFLIRFFDVLLFLFVLLCFLWDFCLFFVGDNSFCLCLVLVSKPSTSHP